MGRPKKEQPNRADGLYEVKITIGKKIDGKLIRKSFYSSVSREDARKQAQEWKLEREVAFQTEGMFIEKNITFGKWAQQWLEVYKKPRVDINTYRLTYLYIVRDYLIPYFGLAELSTIKPIDITKFYSQQSELSESALSKMRMCLNGIFDSAIENDLCYKNPAKSVMFLSKKLKNEKLIYSDEQILQVECYAADKMPEVIILLETGLRRGEMLGLTWEDVDLLNGTIRVNRSIADSKEGVKVNQPKRKSYRMNPLSSRAIATFLEMGKGDGYIFKVHENSPQSPNTWSQKLKRFMVQLASTHPDIPTLTAHELRHTYGTMLRRRGVDIYTIQKVMGHKDIKMTSEIYVHNEISILREAMKDSL